MVARSETRDIYELLGIDSGASTTLAQDVYWRRVNAYLDADRAGDPEARAAIAELNAALAIVLDRTRRAEYDREHQAPGSPGTLADSEARARRRSLVVVGLVPLVGAAMWFALGVGTAAAVATGLVGAALLLFMAHWANEEIVAGMSPFRVLHLRDDATLEDLQSAYQSEVGRLLVRARGDRNAIRDLDALDRAYLRATDLIARGESGAPPSLPQRLSGRLSGPLMRTVRGGGQGLVALSMLVVRALTSLGGRLSAAAGTAAQAGWRGTLRRAPARSAEQDSEVERRLDSAFREVTERIAVAPPPPGEPAEPRVTTRAALVLESAAGKRSVPVGGVPLRIGSNGDCDLVLRQDGVMPEHAMAWVREGSIVLHVIHQHATCLVNGEPTTWAMLDDGDEVSFGEAKVRISIQG